MTEEHKNSIGYSQAAKKEERIFNAEITKSLRTMTETIELDKFIEAEGYEAGSITQEIWEDGVRRGATWQSSQPNPHRIKVAHLMEVMALWDSNQITYSRMVEILNEIAAGKHKERIEI